jgi:hypothetical protein
LFGQTVGLPPDPVGFRPGAGCLPHRDLMFVNGVDDFLGSGADFVALLGFYPLHRALGIAFGLGLGSGRVPLSGLLGRAVLSGLLSSDGILHGRCLRAHRNSLFGALQLGFSRGGMGLRGLGIGDGLHTVRFFALLGLGLLELPSAVSESLPVTAPAISFALPLTESIKPLRAWSALLCSVI